MIINIKYTSFAPIFNETRCKQRMRKKIIFAFIRIKLVSDLCRISHLLWCHNRMNG